ncbi:MAG: BREX-1 system adenine-specific DNA-methyltransferase PglX [Pseudomonadota bacterium]
MNTAQIKSYARQARKDFIQAVTERAHMFGLSDKIIEESEIKGDVAIIGGRAFPKEINEPRKRLISRIQQDGFEMVMRSVAYTWFNRLVALRYMEIHDYLNHGYRVLSNRSGSDVPEILEHAVDLDLPGLNKDKVIELRLAGDKDSELYRLLILAQCNALHRAMPFLFEKINHEAELLLPNNLLHSNSPIRKMVHQIDEADWEEVEIIGWIYQFYISERKDEVIGKVVKSEDIPAATQLFTPNWIVKYMVQNTLGRQWLAVYPESNLRDRMEYYIEPAEQTETVQKQLQEITPDTLDPEKLTLLDPACGSGHILVEAYDLLKAIYQERGYRRRDIPRLILGKNLYGLDIDDRAAQLAGFALMMKARADDPKIFNGEPPLLNVLSIQSSAFIDVESLARVLLKEKVIRFKDDGKLFPEFEEQRVLTVTRKPEVSRDDIIGLLEIFKQGKTLGSLITVPENIAEKLEALKRLADDRLKKGDLFEREAAEKLRPFVRQAALLERKYDCVVTNPPYMGGKGMNPALKNYLKDSYTEVKSDLFSAFIVRNTMFALPKGQLGFMTPFVWMFISSYEKLRSFLIDQKTITSLVQLEYSGFDGATVPICTFTIENAHQSDFKGGYVRLSDFRGAENQGPKTLEAIKNTNCGWFFRASAADFKKIPGSPIAYWVSNRFLSFFSDNASLGDFTTIRAGMATGDGERFIRQWFEVSFKKIGFNCDSRKSATESGFKWFPFNKGGPFRRWFGNIDCVVNFENDGEEIKAFKKSELEAGRITPNNSKCWNQDFYFKPSITWSKIGSGNFSARFFSHGSISSDTSNGVFPHESDYELLGAYLNSKIVALSLKILNPTLNVQVGNLNSLPWKRDIQAEYKSNIIDNALSAKEISEKDWYTLETSWNFPCSPLLHSDYRESRLKPTFDKLRAHCREVTMEMQRLEEENNHIFIESYGLQDELVPDVPLSEITLTCNPHYRYGGNKSEEELETLLLTDTIRELISYAIGCMMGRYSLDEPGLIYAHSGNNGFHPSRYKTFQADDDGIIPVMDLDWFPDDAANRFTEFLKVAWSPDTLEENLKFIADSLLPKRGERPVETIRRYLSTNFFKDHLKTYKKRPIYWLFSSGKHKAFECLVYLHRYNESTLSRMRSAYVAPLHGKVNARMEYLRREIDASTTAAPSRKLQKDLDLLKKKQAELSTFDDNLRHYADMRITLDLDDGVKVNYGKFGNLLAEVKTVTG